MQPKSWWIFFIFFTFHTASIASAEMPNRFEMNDSSMQGYQKLAMARDWQNDCKEYALRQVSAQRPEWAKFVNRLCPYMYTLDDGQASFTSKVSPTRALSKMGTEVLLMGFETIANRFLDKEILQLINGENVTRSKGKTNISPSHEVKASLRLHANRHSLGLRMTISF